MKLLATAGDGEPIDSGLKEDTDVISAPQSHENDRSHSPHMTPTPAATAPQESVVLRGTVPMPCRQLISASITRSR
jgi:hypothetical protein